ncbi:MAG: ribonuclease III domain-containing protein [Candidatus Roizmanbacteria bacterium]
MAEATRDTLEELREFIKNENTFKSFEAYMGALLSTFIPPEHVKIYLSKSHPTLAGKPSGLTSPFNVIEMAFTHKFVSDYNLEGLEALGDAILHSALILFIRMNWPAINEAGLIDNMARYYGNNTQLATASMRLGFPKWLRRDAQAGLTGKDKADIFESFVGSLVMIGEYYIGEHYGEIYGRRFVTKYFQLVDWYPDHPEFYDVPTKLYNDWSNSIPPYQRPKIKSPKEAIRTSDGMHIYPITISGPIIKEMIGVESFYAEGQSPYKKEAQKQAFAEVVAKLKLTRKTIEEIRVEKRSKSEFKVQIEKLQAFAKEKETEFFLTRAEYRGDKTFVFIKENRKEKSSKGKTLHHMTTVARGMGNDELEAATDAIDKLRNGDRYLTLVGSTAKLEDIEIKFEKQDPPVKAASTQTGERRRPPSSKPNKDGKKKFTKK